MRAGLEYLQNYADAKTAIIDAILARAEIGMTSDS